MTTGVGSTPPTGKPNSSTGDGTRALRADARRNRARILAVARQSFAEEGLSLSLDEIARRAGVGPGTVHRHFPTKEGLFEAVILSHIEELAQRAAMLTSATEPGPTFFEFCIHCAQQGAANVALAQALGGVSSSTQTRVATAVADMHRSLGEALVLLQGLGIVRPDVTVADLNGFLAGIHTAAERDPGDPEIPTRMMAIVCDGLRKTPPVD